MKVALTVSAVVAAVAIGFFVGKGLAPPPPPAWLAGDLIISPTDADKDGFCDARIQERRMKGRAFVWVRVGGCRPAAGSYFELRPKDTNPTNQSPLEPDRPRGVDFVAAVADENAQEGFIYYYDLWQVLPDGREKKLFDPEIEIGPPM